MSLKQPPDSSQGSWLEPNHPVAIREQVRVEQENKGVHTQGHPHSSWTQRVEPKSSVQADVGVWVDTPPRAGMLEMGQSMCANARAPGGCGCTTLQVWMCAHHCTAVHWHESEHVNRGRRLRSQLTP